MAARQAILGIEETLLLGIESPFRETGTIEKEEYSRIHGKDRPARLWKRGISAVCHGMAGLLQPQTSNGNAVAWWT